MAYRPDDLLEQNALAMKEQMEQLTFFISQYVSTCYEIKINFNPIFWFLEQIFSLGNLPLSWEQPLKGIVGNDAVTGGKVGAQSKYSNKESSILYMYIIPATGNTTKA